MPLRIIIICLLFSFNVKGQIIQQQSPGTLATLPDWAKEMYSSDPNVFKVARLYKEYYATHPFVKNTHTQQYKRWRKTIGSNINEQGFVRFPTIQQRKETEQAYSQKLKDAASQKNQVTGWSSLGPFRVFDQFGNPAANQTNVSCIDESPSSPNILYAFTEPGEIYKSTNSGNTWQAVGLSYNFDYGGMKAIEIDPTNPNIVYAGAPFNIWKTIDGGLTWNSMLSTTNYYWYEILVDPLNTQIVMAAGDGGLYRSTNGGSTWSQIYTDESCDLKCNTANANIVYLTKNNAATKMPEFLISNNMGASFTVQTNGWYNSTDPNRTATGARIGVTPSDPNRIYVYVVGDSKLGDNGYIGLYRSDNGGSTWYLPNGPDGGPYSTAHPNLASSNNTSGYTLNFYTSAIMVSKSNPDSVLIGGVNCWRSDDGGYTFKTVGGYVGPLNMHADMQDFRAGANGYWVTCDGGIYFSPDFFTAVYPVKMTGIRGSDFWGFGAGWNQDMFIGGTYHNGTLAYHENYPAGDFICLAGGEPSTGFVSPTGTRETYGSGTANTILPLNIGGPSILNGWGISPNESYVPGYSSELEFHPNLYNTNFAGYLNKLWKSGDDGATYTVIATFGTSTLATVTHIEISRSNPNVMYVAQTPSVGTTGTLWKTTNGGLTWASLPIPTASTNSERILLTMSPTNENEVWMAYVAGTNGNKIYKTTNGGTTWTNLTTSLLDNESPHSIVHYGGTNGGVYYCTNAAVYYRNNTMPNWVIYNTGLPAYCNTDICRPFYKQDKIRIGTYGKGIWESDLYEPAAAPVAQISADKNSYQIVCVNDSFRFKDYSMINYTGATWQWTFQNGSPATSTSRNQSVLFSIPGTHLVTLKVTNSASISSIDSMYITVTQPAVPNFVSEGFQSAWLPVGWTMYDQLNDAPWALTNTAGGYGASTQCALFDNFSIDSQGSSDDMRFRLDLSSATTAKLKFDVAYARYDNTTFETMQVLASTNCGLSFTTLFTKSGSTLATAPDNTSLFVPSATEWRTDSVALTSYIGQSNVMIAIRNIGNWGNALYVDNINLNGVPLKVQDQKVFADGVIISPNPVMTGNNISILTDRSQHFQMRFYDVNGKEVFSKNSLTNETIQLPAELAPGIYFYTLMGETIMKRGKLTILAERK
jgi:photosystem II stability/assembly factor-like uncharacterized protein